jgi:hypothetical protein
VGGQHALPTTTPNRNGTDSSIGRRTGATHPELPALKELDEVCFLPGAQAEVEAAVVVIDHRQQVGVAAVVVVAARLCYCKFVAFITKRLRLEVRAARLPQSVVRETTIKGAF